MDEWKNLSRIEILHPLTDVVVYGGTVENIAVVSRVLVGSGARSDIAAASEHAPAPQLQGIAELIHSYLDGRRIDFSGIRLAAVRTTAFASRVRAAARLIAFGQTCSYSDLAGRAGFPGAVRAAASVMRNNPFPLIVPCHRIIRKNGTAGAYNGDFTGEDAALKVKLLRLENAVRNSSTDDFLPSRRGNGI